MSEIKKWVGDKIKSLGRCLEEGRDKRPYGSIDYSGPVPRVTIKTDSASKKKAKSIPRGFWVVRPDERLGMLFGTEGVRKDNFKYAGGTYVVGPIKTDFNNIGISPDNYRDVWYVDKSGDLYVNGQPFPNAKKTMNVGAKSLAFLETTKTGAVTPVHTYNKTGVVTAGVYNTITERMVGVANLAKDGVAVVLPVSATSMYSTADGNALADTAPGWHWTFSTTTGVKTDFFMSGARSLYLASDPDNLAPISTHKIVYKTEDDTIVYTHTGGGYTGGYIAPTEDTDTISVKTDDPSGIQNPVVGSSGSYSAGGRTEVVNPLSNCYIYGGVADSVQANFTANIGGSVIGDLRFADPTSDTLISVNLHENPVVVTPNITQSFFGVLLNTSIAATNAGKRGAYTDISTIVDWGLSASTFPHNEYIAGASQVIGFSSSPVPDLADAHFLGTWTSNARIASTQVVRIGARKIPSPMAGVNGTPISDPRSYSGSDTRRRLFNGLVSKTGYKSGGAVAANSGFGTLSTTNVSTSFRRTSASGTKYTYNGLNYANVPSSLSGVSGDRSDKIPLNTWVSVSVSVDDFGNTCWFPPALGTPEVCAANNQEYKTITDQTISVIETDVSARTYFWWHWKYSDGSNPFNTSSAYSDTKTGGGTRYEFTSKDYLFYNPDFEITIEASLLKDFGVGASFDQEGNGSTAENITIIMNTKYLGELVDSRTIYSGDFGGHLNFNDKYYGMGQGWDSLYDPMNSFPIVTSREPVVGIFPPYLMQETCPFVAFTTAEEVAGGAEPQFYIDMPIRLCNPKQVADSDTLVKFPPMQLLNHLVWMTAPIEGDSDGSVSGFNFMDKLHQFLIPADTIRLRMYKAGGAVVKDVLPPELQAKYDLSVVHFGRI